MSRPFSRREALSIAAAAPFLFSTARGDEPLCGKCRSTGWIANPKFGDRRDYEPPAHYCSEVFDSDPAGGGFDKIPCVKCLTVTKVAAAAKEHTQRLELMAKWREGTREVDKLAGTRSLHCQTKRFEFTFDLPTVKIGNAVYDSHRAMHLYAKRAEDFFAEVQEFHGISDEEVNGKVRHHIAMLERQVHAKALAPHLTHLDLQGAAKVHKIGSEVSATVCWEDPRYVKSRGDAGRYQFLIHLLAHHVYHDLKGYEWWLYDRHGWLFDGTAHYWEYRKFGSPFVNCAQEQSGGPIDISTTFESSVRKLVNANQVAPLAAIVERNCATLSLAEKQFAWSYVDFLCWWDAKAFKKLMQGSLKRDVAARDAIKDAYGLSMPQIQERWEAFVKANYQLKERKGPLVHAPRKVS
jgi:hypothetical protein